MKEQSAKNNEIEIRFVKDWPVKEIIGLYKAGGWWDDSKPSVVKKIISGSFAFAVAVEKESGKAIGMGRVLSDGTSDAYIQDVIVLSAYRKRDAGKNIVTALRDYCLKKKICWIALVAQASTEDFYSALGFRVMRGHTPMKYVAGLGKRA